MLAELTHSIAQDEVEMAVHMGVQELLPLVGQLAIGLQTRMAAPEPAKRRRRARSRRLLRLPFQTKGVGSAFQPATVCSSHSITRLEHFWDAAQRGHGAQ